MIHSSISSASLSHFVVYGSKHQLTVFQVLGGCSCLNSMLYVRGNRGDFDEWAQKFGCRGWSYRDVLPFFMKAEGL